MIPSGSNSAQESTPLARREGTRDQGGELLMRVAALFRIARTYSFRNQLFEQQVRILAETARPLLATNGEIQFVSFGGEIFLDGIRVATTSQGYRMARSLVEEFESRGIAGFEAREGARVEDWNRFFEFVLDPRPEPGETLTTAAERLGLDRISPIERVRASEAEDRGSSVDSEGEGIPTQGTPSPESPRADREVDLGAVGGRVSSTAAAALGAAPKHYAAALAGLHSILMSTTAQRGLELRHARRVVQPIVDSALAKEPVVLGLAGLIRRDEYTYARNVNACVIATAIAHRLGFDRAALASLSTAALLHGIGRAVTSDPDGIGAAGAVLLARRATMNETTIQLMEVAFEAGSGQVRPGRSTIQSQIVGIAATYARLASARHETGRVTTPSQALGMVISPLASAFDPALKVALVESLGFHPPGQFVELDDRSIAFVIAPNRDDLERPILHVVRGPGSESVVGEQLWDGGVLPTDRTIVRDLGYAELPEDVFPMVEPRAT